MPRVAILTGGGIAPCLSAAIGGLIEKYNELSPSSEIIGYEHGYRGLLVGKSIKFSETVKKNYSTLYNFGGTPIGNSRVKLTNVEDCVKKGYILEGKDPLEVAGKQLEKDRIDILHTIGGDDTNTMAAALAKHLEKSGNKLTVVGLPKTVDNDVIPVKQTLGAWTAAEQGARFFQNIVNENTTSRRQLIIHEVMGRHCGWLTAGTAYEYRKSLEKAHGKEKASAILGRDRFNNLVWPNLNINAQFHQIRVVHPISVNETVIEGYCFRLEGAPDEIFYRSVRFLGTLVSPASMIFSDDLEIFERVQHGLENGGIKRLDTRRGITTDRIIDETTGEMRSTSSSELPLRSQIGAWKHWMTSEK